MKIVYIVDPHFMQGTPSSRLDDYGLTVISKFRWVLSYAESISADRVIVGGDVWNHKNISFPYWNMVVDMLNSATCKVYSIIGNHDIYYDRLDTLNRTPLGALFRTGALRHPPLVEEVVEEKHTIRLVCRDFGSNQGSPTPGCVNIMVSHSFFEVGGVDVLFSEDLSGFQIAMLGHDHDEYPIEAHNGCVVLRPGSLTRGMASKMNQTRIPKIAVIDTDTMIATYVEVPCAPASEVFSAQAIQVNTSKREMRDFVKSLDVAVVSEGSSVRTLVSECAPDEEVRKRTEEHLQKESILGIIGLLVPSLLFWL